MASARLRKAFRYPDDSGDDNTREEQDEEEQERVIRHLKLQDAKHNSEYSNIFTAIPLLSTIIFLPSLLSSAPLPFSIRLSSLLGIASLLATAYTMKYVPPQRPDPKGKRPIRNPDLMTHVRTWIIPGNSAVSAFLGLVYVFSAAGTEADSSGSAVSQPVVYLVPGVLLAAVMIVRRVMVSVDLKTLEDLRYEYKGA